MPRCAARSSGADELAREKQVVLGEYDRAESSPWFRLDATVGHQLWGSFWSRKNTIGDRDVIANVTPEQMKTIRDLYYVPNNSALIVAGDVAPERIFALAEGIFGSWPRRADPFVRSPIPPVSPLRENQGVIVEERVNAVTVQIQWHGPGASADQDATFARRRLLGHPEPADLAIPGAARGERTLARRGRELLHAEPCRADHGERADVAGEAARRRSRRSTPNSTRRSSPDTSSAEELEAVKAQSRGDHRVRPGACVGERTHDRLLVERDRARLSPALRG